MFTLTEQKELLTLARNSIKFFLEDKKLIDDYLCKNDNFKKQLGVFVTLHEKDGALRGCIGVMKTRGQLYETIIRHAILAAVDDNRFTPVTIKELPNLEIEISVLSEMQPANYEEIVPKQDGVIIKHNNKSATFLPQVWDEIPDKETFFDHLKQKAGIKSEIANEDLNIKTYQAFIFNEKIFK